MRRTAVLQKELDDTELIDREHEQVSNWAKKPREMRERLTAMLSRPRKRAKKPKLFFSYPQIWVHYHMRRERKVQIAARAGGHAGKRRQVGG
jgi:hypothetical protein